MRHVRCSTRLHVVTSTCSWKNHLLSLPPQRLCRPLSRRAAATAPLDRGQAHRRLARRRLRQWRCRWGLACAIVGRVKGYHEYLELYAYFAAPGTPKLSRADYDNLDQEYKELASRHAQLTSDERARLGELKAVLYRDKP